jgi:hypothetical protein
MSSGATCRLSRTLRAACCLTMHCLHLQVVCCQRCLQRWLLALGVAVRAVDVTEVHIKGLVR